MSGDDDLYELVLGDYRHMRDTISGLTAALPHVGTESISVLARMLVEAEDAMAEFVAGPMFTWLVAEAVERQDPRFDTREMIGTYASNRWLPVLIDLDGTPFEDLHPVRDPVALSIAGALLTAHTDNGVEGGIVTIHRRVAEAIEARHGAGAADDFDIDRIVEHMVCGGEALDSWNFGVFWLAVEDSRLANRPTDAWTEELYEQMVDELVGLQSRHAAAPEEHGEELYDFLDSPAFAWLWGELAERDDDRVDWEPLQFDADQNRWGPVLDAFGGYGLDPDAVQLCDAESYLAAAAELSLHVLGGRHEVDDGRQSVRRCVANALDRRLGPGAAERFDLDTIIATMREVDAETPDDWDFGTFWVVVGGQG